MQKQSRLCQWDSTLPRLFCSTRRACRRAWLQPTKNQRAAKLGVGDALAAARIEEMKLRGADRKAAFLARLGEHMAALAHGDQFARFAETAMQQRVGAQRLGH